MKLVALGVAGLPPGKAGVALLAVASECARASIASVLPRVPKERMTLDRACLVICEVTGGHEAALLDALVEAGRAAHRADARKVKAFI